MSYPGASAIYKNCAMCGAPFRVWQYALRAGNRGKFCGRQCFYIARQAFSIALENGLLEAFLTPIRAEARRMRAARKTSEYTARKLAGRADWRVSS
jgi:hypothetical protein